MVNVINKKVNIAKIFEIAKKSKDAKKCGMFLFHNGVVRITPKMKVRGKASGLKDVKFINFSYDKKKVECAIKNAKKLKGIYYVDVWLNNGKLNVGDDIMYVIVGGDIRDRVIKGLTYLVGEIKSKCVIENEIFV